MIRRLILGCIAASLLPSTVSAQSATRHSSTHSARRGPTPHVRQAMPQSPVPVMLSRRVERVSWQETPLKEVLDWFRKQSPKGVVVNVVPRWRQLGSQGIDRDTPVSLQLVNVTVGHVLSEVLDQLSGRDPLTYIAHGNTLRITTRSDLQNRLFTRTYDVNDLVDQLRARRVQPRLNIGQQNAVAIPTITPAAGVGANAQTFDTGTFMYDDGRDNDDDDDEDRDQEYEQRIIEVIQTTIEPGAWSVNGGPGSLAILNGVLIAHTSADVHQLLGGPFDPGR